MSNFLIKSELSRKRMMVIAGLIRVMAMSISSAELRLLPRRRCRN